MMKVYNGSIIERTNWLKNFLMQKNSKAFVCVIVIVLSFCTLPQNTTTITTDEHEKN